MTCWEDLSTIWIKNWIRDPSKWETISTFKW